MKRLFAAALLVLVPALASAEHYKIDPDHSQITFKVRHLGISWVPGTFTKVEGEYDFDQKNIAAAKASARIDVTSVDTKNKKRDDHLRGDDFFATGKYPDIQFVSKQIKNIQGNKFTVVGDLTMHGVTKPIELQAEFTGAAKDPYGNQRSAFTAETKLNRKDFGLEWSKVLETGALVVGDEVVITLEVEGVKA